MILTSIRYRNSVKFIQRETFIYPQNLDAFNQHRNKINQRDV